MVAIINLVMDFRTDPWYLHSMVTIQNVNAHILMVIDSLDPCMQSIYHRYRWCDMLVL